MGMVGANFFAINDPYGLRQQLSNDLLGFLRLGGSSGKDDVPSNHITKLDQALLEFVRPFLGYDASSGGAHVSDPPYTLFLLRPRSQRPRGCCATEKRDEFPPYQLPALVYIDQDRIPDDLAGGSVWQQTMRSIL